MFERLSAVLAHHSLAYAVTAGVVFATGGLAVIWLNGREDLGLSGRWTKAGLQALAAGAGMWGANVLAFLSLDRRGGVLSPEIGCVAFVVAVAAALPAFLAVRPRNPKNQPVRDALVVTGAFTTIHYLLLSGFKTADGVAVIAELDWRYQAAGVALAAGLLLVARMIGGLRLSPTRAAATLPLTIGALASIHLLSLAGTVIADRYGDLPASTGSAQGAAVIVVSASLLIMSMAAGMSLLASLGERAALRRLRTATDAMPSALALFDEDGRLIVWNATFEIVTAGFGANAREGMPFAEMLRVMPTPDGVFAAEDPPPREQVRVEFEIPGGMWIRVDNVPTAQGGILSLGTDITEAKRSEAALAEALGQARSASRSKSEFLATMSHEIRTPLNGVLGMAQAMARDELSESQRARLQVIQSAGESLLSLLNDVLDFSKVEAGKLEIADGVFDVGELGASVQATFSTLAAEKDVSLTLNVSRAACGHWRGDPVRVRQVLQNLVSNAVKFTSRGVVSVDIGHDGRALMFRVADTGIGIAEPNLARIFDSFAQADSSTTRHYGGSGLGLSISRALVEMMGGAIQVESVVGQGTTFTVRLPLERASAPVEQPVAGSEPEAAAHEGLRILVAEDNQMNQLVLRTLLGQIGIEPHIVASGEEAVAAWRDGRWDVILMDVQMPGMDGPTATRQIRSEERALGVRTPIIALTANAMSHHREEYRAAGMDGFVAKPINFAELVAAISAAIDPEEGADSEQPAASG